MSEPKKHSNTIELAWAVPVCVDVLGAHLQAYVVLRPVLNALRLCNRFGKGGNGITKLPIEMVEHIEQHLLESDRALRRKYWEEDFKCWEGRCKPVEHLSPKMIHQLFHEMQGTLKKAGKKYFAKRFLFETEDLACAAHTDGEEYQHSPAHANYQIDSVTEYLDDNLQPLRYPVSRVWRDECKDRKLNWERRAGFTMFAPSRGLLGDLSKYLTRDFGLRVWSGHSECKAPDNAYNKDSCGRTTTAYLQISNKASRVHRKWEPHVSAWPTHTTGPDEAMTTASSENSFATPAVVPPTPTAKSLARFDRAVKSLKLELVVSSAENEGEGSSGGEDKAQNIPKDAAEIVPRLMMFSVNKDDIV